MLQIGLHCRNRCSPKSQTLSCEAACGLGGRSWPLGSQPRIPSLPISVRCLGGLRSTGECESEVVTDQKSIDMRYAQKLCAPSSGGAFDHLNSVFELYSFDHLGQALRPV